MSSTIPFDQHVPKFYPVARGTLETGRQSRPGHGAKGSPIYKKLIKVVVLISVVILLLPLEQQCNCNEESIIPMFLRVTEMQQLAAAYTMGFLMRWIL